MAYIPLSNDVETGCNSQIQYFEFQVKLLGPLWQTKMEVKFLTSLWRSLLSCLFVRTGLSCRKYDYLTETKVMNLFLKTETWVFRTRLKEKLGFSPHCRESLSDDCLQADGVLSRGI